MRCHARAERAQQNSFSVWDAYGERKRSRLLRRVGGPGKGVEPSSVDGGADEEDCPTANLTAWGCGGGEACADDNELWKQGSGGADKGQYPRQARRRAGGDKVRSAEPHRTQLSMRIAKKQVRRNNPPRYPHAPVPTCESLSVLMSPAASSDVAGATTAAAPPSPLAPAAGGPPANSASKSADGEATPGSGRVLIGPVSWCAGVLAVGCQNMREHNTNSHRGE